MTMKTITQMEQMELDFKDADLGASMHPPLDMIYRDEEKRNIYERYVYAKRDIDERYANAKREKEKREKEKREKAEQDIEQDIYARGVNAMREAKEKHAEAKREAKREAEENRYAHEKRSIEEAGRTLMKAGYEISCPACDSGGVASGGQLLK